MARILATAENFAFGPVGKLATVAQALAAHGHELSFVGYGTAFQIARQAQCWQAHEIDTAAVDFSSRADPLFATHDLLISCLDVPSAEHALACGTPVVWLDPLSWWWDSTPAWLANVDLHIAQRSIAPDPRSPAAASAANLLEVGPIVDLSPLPERAKTTNNLHVNFGGGEAAGWYEIGRDTNYPYQIIELLVTHMDLSGFDSVLVTANEKVVEEAARRWPGDRLRFACLDHNRFLASLANSAVFLTVPGLEAPLEAWSYGVPTLFLPPSNSSQYVQLDEYRRRGAAPASVHLRDFYPALDLMALPLRTRSAAFMRQLQDFEGDPAALLNTAAELNRMLNDRSAWAGASAGGKSFVTELGPAGLELSVDAIEHLLDRRGGSRR
jgi:hypothetical protein